MARWVEVARVDEIPAGRGRTVLVDDQRIALFNDDGRYFATDDACPHQGASLAEGLLHEGRVICPWHSWIFELGTGRCPRDTHEPVTVYPTRCSNGAVEIQIKPD